MRISSSKVKTYKACHKLYFFKYIEELTPEATPQTLTDGLNYHAGVEAISRGETPNIDIENEPKISAMISAYEKYIKPAITVSQAEVPFELKLTSNVTLVGRFDGLTDSGVVVEHKTTSNDLDDEYLFDLRWDEQVLNYMLASGKNIVIYTVCKKPTIRQKQNETAEEYYNRCLDWYAEDTERRIGVTIVQREAEELAEQKKQLINIAHEMARRESRKDKEKAFYRNPNYCGQYGRRCEFASICLDYNPQFLPCGFKKGEEA